MHKDLSENGGPLQEMMMIIIIVLINIWVSLEIQPAGKKTAISSGNMMPINQCHFGCPILRHTHWLLVFQPTMGT